MRTLMTHSPSKEAALKLRRRISEHQRCAALLAACVCWMSAVRAEQDAVVVPLSEPVKVQVDTLLKEFTPFDGFTPDVEKKQHLWFEKLIALGPGASPGLLQALEAGIKNQDLASAVERALMKFAQEKEDGERRLLNDLQTKFSNASAPLKLRIVELLQLSDTAQAEALLVACLSENSPALRCAAMDALERRRAGRTAQAAMFGVLRNGVPDEKKQACITLGQLKYVPAIPELIKLLASTESGLSENALWALRNITGLSGGANPESWTSWLNNAQENNQRDLALLIGEVKSGPAKFRPLVVEEMAKFVLLQDKVIVAVLGFLNDPDFRVRAAACDVLSQTSPSSQTCARLIEKLRDSSDVVAASAWRALKQLTGQNLPNKYDEWSHWFRKHG